MRIIAIILMSLLCSVCAAQDLKGAQVDRRLQLDPAALPLTRMPLKSTSISDVHFTVADLQVQIPAQYDNESKKKIGDLLKEFKHLCPNCSTVGTIGGTTIIGGAGRPSTQQLFPVSSQQVLVNKIELEELKRKAALYDQIQRGNNE